MNKVKYIIKLLISSFLFYSGFLHLYKKFYFKNRTVVLMYHRILSSREHINSHSHDGIIVHTDSFNKQVKFLARHFHIFTFNDFSAHMKKQQSFSGVSCLITFDDGWYDNYHNAFPILKTYDAAAHIFLPVHFISNSDNFWQEKLSHYLCHLCHHPELFNEFLIKHDLIKYSTVTPDERKTVIRKYVATLKCFSPDEINQLISEYESEMTDKNCPAPSNIVDTYLNWSNIIEMQEHKISFGSHAVSHHMLTKLTQHQLESELTESKVTIEEKTKKTANSIAYPNGNHDKIVCETCKNTGYEFGFTTEHGFAIPATDPFRIPRINIHNDMTKYIPLFYCRILGIF